eukprot:TRINITY_DN59905_c0_g1_i1.p1 TRINITY_DN59905_c0_g1~~TRINITY_DN59905_c0_g1_i1.p1  ORF type:complete len:518 (+),score=141.01 TRINITY_DN59905_c0_g1_i1:76-1629(+)
MGTTGAEPELRIASRPRHAKVLRVPQDYASVQAAVMAASDGDCIALSSGTHELQEPICIDREVHLIAGDEGSEGVIIRLDATNSRLLRAATHMITVDCESCRIAHVTLEHVGGKGDPSLDQELVFAIWCRRGSALIDQCDIRAEVHSAVGVSAAAQPTISRSSIRATQYGTWVEKGARKGLRVERCRFDGIRRGVYFNDSTNGEVEQCEFASCGTAVECLSGCDTVIAGNSFRNCSEGVYCSGGVQLDDATVVQVYGNDFAVGNGRGLVADRSRPEVTKNAFTGCTDCAAEFCNSAKGKFVSNTIEGGACGARVTGQSNPLFRRNTFEGCSTVGLCISGERSAGTFVANTFESCPVGIEVRERANPTVVSNVLRGADVALAFNAEGLGRVRSNAVEECGRGAVILEKSDPVLDQNEISKCGASVVVDGAKGTLIQNEFVGSEEASLQLIGSLGTIIEENVIRDSEQEGVLATHGAAATLSRNTIRGNMVAPVQSSEDSRATVVLLSNTTHAPLAGVD